MKKYMKNQTKSTVPHKFDVFLYISMRNRPCKQPKCIILNIKMAIHRRLELQFSETRIYCNTY